MRVADFDYALPDELIARHPASERSGSRLLLLDGRDGALQHRAFRDIIDLLDAGDLLVFNDTRVIPARLFGHKEVREERGSNAAGGKVEILVERILDDGRHVLAHVRASKSPKPGSHILLDDGSRLLMKERRDALFLLEFPEDALTLLARLGHMPLPPYIDRDDTRIDRERYQTVYATKPGAVAAPTAGLHFDEPLLAALAAKGVNSTTVTLHVGAGTFQPVRVENVEDHRMHAEIVDVGTDACDAIRATRAAGKRVVAVGTTSARSLESAALFTAEMQVAENLQVSAGQLISAINPGNKKITHRKNAPNDIKPFHGETDIFIYPGRPFRVVDALITNFHLPKSTLLMLVSAFAGTGNIRHAYLEAVRERYRFFSYGDAMFIPFPQPDARAAT